MNNGLLAEESDVKTTELNLLFIVDGKIKRRGLNFPSLKIILVRYQSNWWRIGILNFPINYYLTVLNRFLAEIFRFNPTNHNLPYFIKVKN